MHTMLIRFGSASLLLAAVLLYGCAGVEAEYYERARTRSLADAAALQTAAACCEQLSEFSYQPLAAERTPLRFGGEGLAGRVRQFASGRSHFVPIDIGTDRKTLLLTVRSIMWRESKDQLEVFVAPSVLALDENFNIVSELARLDMCFQQHWSEVGYYGSLRVDASKARYLIFYTDPAVVASTSDFHNSVTTAYGDISVDRQVPHSAIGDMEIWERTGKDKNSYNGCSASNQI